MVNPQYPSPPKPEIFQTSTLATGESHLTVSSGKHYIPPHDADDAYGHHVFHVLIAPTVDTCIGESFPYCISNFSNADQFNFDIS